MTARKKSSAFARRPQPSWLLALAVVFFAAPIHAQSLGDIARQARAQKQSQPQETPSHVYDNDDLLRPKILLPPDLAHLKSTAQSLAPAPAPATAPAANSATNTNATAKSNSAAAPAVTVNATATANSTSTAPPATVNATAEANAVDEYADTNSMPLGDIARHYRALKAAREQQQAQSSTTQPALVAHQAQPTIAVVSPVADATPSAETTPNAGTTVTAVATAPVDENSMPLGDIARYYRALKAAREQEQALTAAQQHPLPTTPALAEPTFTQPRTRPVAPATSPAPLRAVRAARAVRQSVPATVTRVRVRHGDTLWNLARKYLGHAKDWQLLAARNPQISAPTRLQIGMLLTLPNSTREAAPTQSAQRRSRVKQSTQTVRVQVGDSLWKLSQLYIGNASAWSCIASANPALENPNLIIAGQNLTIPAACASRYRIDSASLN